MPRFAANLSMLYPEHNFLDRFAAAAADGFDAVEYLFPYAFTAAALAAQLQAHGLTQALFNAPPGDFDAGERGLACLPDRVDEFRRGFVEQALPYAQALGCRRVHVMAGLAPAGVAREALGDCYQDNLAWAAAQAAPHGVAVQIEPINTRDIPGYFLNRQDTAHALVQAIGAPNLQVQFDLYHCQIVEGDLAMKLRKHIAGIGLENLERHIVISGARNAEHVALGFGIERTPVGAIFVAPGERFRQVGNAAAIGQHTVAGRNRRNGAQLPGLINRYR